MVIRVHDLGVEHIFRLRVGAGSGVEEPRVEGFDAKQKHGPGFPVGDVRRVGVSPFFGAGIASCDHLQWLPGVARVFGDALDDGVGVGRVGTASRAAIPGG